MEKNKSIALVIGSLVIISLVVFIIINKDDIFRNEVVREYSDGCVERYVNYELVTEKCIEPEEIIIKPYGTDIFANLNLTNNKTL